MIVVATDWGNKLYELFDAIVITETDELVTIEHVWGIELTKHEVDPTNVPAEIVN